jgi:hypothetical protein
MFHKKISDKCRYRIYDAHVVRYVVHTYIAINFILPSTQFTNNNPVALRCAHHTHSAHSSRCKPARRSNSALVKQFKSSAGVGS